MKKGNILLWTIQEIFLFLFGGFIYYGIEILWRGYSHYTMIILGGLCFIIIGLINETFSYSMYIEYQILIGDIIVTILELIFGIILNLYLGLGIWDYTNMPLNILGQICVPYMVLWLFLVALAIFVDDYAKYLLSELIYNKFKLFTTAYRKPKYNSLIYKKISKE